MLLAPPFGSGAASVPEIDESVAGSTYRSLVSAGGGFGGGHATLASHGAPSGSEGERGDSASSLDDDSVDCDVVARSAVRAPPVSATDSEVDVSSLGAATAPGGGFGGGHATHPSFSSVSAGAEGADESASSRSSATVCAFRGGEGARAAPAARLTVDATTWTRRSRPS